MSKYISFFLVIGYSFFAISTFFIVIDVFGWLPLPQQDTIVLGSLLCWLLFCFSAGGYLPDFLLYSLPVRIPLPEEEQRIRKILADLPYGGHDPVRYRLVIQEEEGINIFAIGYRTIVVTSGLLKKLDNPEIKALLAPELEHLTNKSGAAAIAFLVTDYLPRLSAIALHDVRRALAKIMRLASFPGGFLGLGLIIFLFCHFPLLSYAGALLSYMLLLRLYKVLFRFLWQLNSRYTAFRQDAMAHKMGQGPDTRRALVKMIANMPKSLNFFSVFKTESSFLSNRVRRLERLEEHADGKAHERYNQPNGSIQVLTDRQDTEKRFADDHMPPYK